MKAIRQSQTREILDAYNREDISYSRMNEMFNEIAEEFAIGFSKFIEIECVKTEYLHQYIHNDKEYNIKALLQKFKEQKGL
jgi:hypothetical protein